MKAVHDSLTDTLTLVLNDAKVVESDEEVKGVIIDRDKDGNPVAIEILNASTKCSDITQISLLHS